MEAVDLFLAIIGAEAGYMGLRSLASGGIYICGGIIPRVSCLACLSCYTCCLMLKYVSKEHMRGPRQIGTWHVQHVSKPDLRALLNLRFMLGSSFTGN